MQAVDGQSEIATGHHADGAAADQRGAMLILLVLVAIINNADRAIFAIAMPAIKADYAFSDAQLGLLGGLSFGLCYGLAAIPIGYLALRFNRRNLLVGCLALWSCATALTSFARGFGGLFAARSVVGMGEAGGMPLSLSLTAARYAPAERAASTGWLSAGQSIGGVLGAWITGWVIAHAGWRNAFLLMGLPGLALALALWRFVEEPPRTRIEPARLGEVLALWRKPGMGRLTIAFVLAGIVSYGVNQWLPTFYARRFHLNPAAMGMLVGNIGGLSGVAGALAGGYIVRHFGRTRAGFAMEVTALVSLLAVPAGWVACYAPNLALSEAMMVLAQFAGSFRVSLLYTAMQNFADGHTRPMAIAIIAAAVVLVGSGVGPVLLGAVSDHAAGGIVVAMAFGFSVQALVAVYCWQVARVQQREARHAMMA